MITFFTVLKYIHLFTFSVILINLFIDYNKSKKMKKEFIFIKFSDLDFKYFYYLCFFELGLISLSVMLTWFILLFSGIEKLIDKM